MSNPVTDNPRTLLQFNPNRRLPWARGAGYGADTYLFNYAVSEPMTTLYQGDDLVYSQESGSISLHLKEAWAHLRTPLTTRIAVIDPNGIDLEHPCYAASVIDSGNVPSDRTLPVPAHYHGTGVASCVALTAPGVKLALYVCPARGISGTVANPYVKAIEWAKEAGCRIVVIPSAVPNDEPTRVAIENCGMLIFCSALNEPVNHDLVNDYPTTWRFPNVLTITNCMRDGQLLTGGAGYGAETIFTGVIGRRVVVAVPGGGYGFETGASFSAPQAAGVAALLMHAYPTETNAQIVARMRCGIQLLDSLAGKVQTNGILRADLCFDAPPEP